jgi:predicted protein tyrosine phosphatase
LTERKKRILFVCSRNQWRSPTAERIFSRSVLVEVRSRGVSASAVRRLTPIDVTWADIIFVMEPDHKRQLLKQFRADVGERPVYVLDIPDEYQAMDPELVDLLKAGVQAVMGPL